MSVLPSCYNCAIAYSLLTYRVALIHHCSPPEVQINSFYFSRTGSVLTRKKRRQVGDDKGSGGRHRCSSVNKDVDIVCDMQKSVSTLYRSRTSREITAERCIRLPAFTPRIRVFVMLIQHHFLNKFCCMFIIEWYT